MIQLLQGFYRMGLKLWYLVREQHLTIPIILELLNLKFLLHFVLQAYAHMHQPNLSILLPKLQIYIASVSNATM